MSRNRKCSPCKDCSCDVIRVDKVPTATSRISLNRCSTPISSASSASMIEGVCTKVLDVVVPSWRQTLAKVHYKARSGNPYIFDLLNRKVCICRYTSLLRLNIDNNQ